MPLPVGIDVVYVEIVDECMLQSDHMIGWACVPIPEELLVAGGEMPRKSYPLSGKQGPNLEGTVDGKLYVYLKFRLRNLSIFVTEIEARVMVKM